MDFKTTTVMAMGFLLIVMSLSLLGLAADSMAYANGHQNDDLQIHYYRFNETAESQYSYWLKMDYTPSKFTLGRESAMIANGVISAVAGIVVVTLAALMRQPAARRFGIPPWTTSMVTAAIAFATSLAVAVYAWQPVMKWNINFLKSLPVPSAISGAASEKALIYQSPFAFTPETWNCFLAPYAANSATSGRLQGLCQEAHAAKSLTIPIVVFTALLFGLTGYGWWTASSTTTAKPEKEGKDIEEVSMASRD